MMANLYGPGGIERVKIIKRSIRSVIENLTPLHFPYLMEWTKEFKDPGRELYNSFTALSKQDQLSFINSKEQWLPKGTLNLMSVGFSYDDMISNVEQWRENYIPALMRLQPFVKNLLQL